MFSGDGDCDDGGPGFDYEVCPFGSDCLDCGVRNPAPDWSGQYTGQLSLRTPWFVGLVSGELVIIDEATCGAAIHVVATANPDGSFYLSGSTFCGLTTAIEFDDDIQVVSINSEQVLLEVTIPPGGDGFITCDNTCASAYDGQCDDGAALSLDASCAFGTDCSDCGTRMTEGVTATGVMTAVGYDTSRVMPFTATFVRDDQVMIGGASSPAVTQSTNTTPYPFATPIYSPADGVNSYTPMHGAFELRKVE
jgi:hypothetical protein